MSNVIAFQSKIRKLKKKFLLFIQTRLLGGSGFRMAGLLRHFFLEYQNRLIEYGPYSFPSSFNVAEGFLTFKVELMSFDILQERDHLLRLHDYFDWYTAEKVLPDDPKILIDTMEEGVIYSFDIAGDTGEYVVSTEGSNIAIAGISITWGQANSLTRESKIISPGIPDLPSFIEIEKQLKNPLIWNIIQP